MQQPGGEAESKISDEKDRQSETITLTYDECVRQFGIGRYQVFLVVMLSLTTWSLAANNDLNVWLGASMKHTCVVPADQSMNNYTIKNFGSKDQCSYKTYRIYNDSSNDSFNGITQCIKWTYDTTFFNSTIVSAWDLNACGGRWKISTAASLYMAGFFFGCILLGDLSDRYGRLKMLCASQVGTCITGVIAALSVNMEMFMALRFLQGLFVAGSRSPSGVYMSEILTPSLRSITGPTISLAFSLSGIILTTMAKYLRDWESLYIATSLACSFVIPYFWFFYESPRWLLMKGRHDECVKYFKRSAQVNRVPFPRRLEIAHKKTPAGKPNYINLFKTKTIRWITVIHCFSLFLGAAVASGATLNTGNLAGDIFTNMYLTQVSIGLIAFLAIPPMKHSRKLVVAVGFIGTAVTCAVAAVLMSYQDLRDVVTAVPIIAAFGRGLISWTIAGLTVMGSEHYPTMVRVSAFGLSAAVSRFGSVIAPYIALSNDLSRNLPYIIFGVASLIAGLLSLALPETVNRNPPESIEEMEQMYHLALPCRQRGNNKDEDSIKPI